LTLPRRALLLLPALAACYAYAPPPWAAANPDSRRPAAAGSGDDSGQVRGRIVERALRYLGHPFNGDCSGYVRQVMREAGVELGPLPSARSMSESLHLVSHPVRAPAPGDLVFFHDTYDRNRDGALGDLWTHVALVEAVDGDQVWILHRGGKGILRLKMNLALPHDEAANDPVRARDGRDPPGTRYLTGELFAGYGAVVE
jgi:hypothetical protein